MKFKPEITTTICKISAHVVALNVKLGLKLKRVYKLNHDPVG